MAGWATAAPDGARVAGSGNTGVAGTTDVDAEDDDDNSAGGEDDNDDGGDHDDHDGDGAGAGGDDDDEDEGGGGRAVVPPNAARAGRATRSAGAAAGRPVDAWTADGRAPHA